MVFLQRLAVKKANNIVFAALENGDVKIAK